MKKPIIYLLSFLSFITVVSTTPSMVSGDYQNYSHYEEQSRQTASQQPPQSIKNKKVMSGNEVIDLVQNLGPVFVICMAAFWFIKYQSDRMKEIQDEFMKKDSEADNRVFEILERNHEVISNHTASLEANTKSMDALIATLGQRKGTLR